MKFSIPIEGPSPQMMSRYAGLCGWTLARAHARSGDAATISGYLGKSDAFDQAIGEFALAYADQTARDHAQTAANPTGGVLFLQGVCRPPPSRAALRADFSPQLWHKSPHNGRSGGWHKPAVFGLFLHGCATLAATRTATMDPRPRDCGARLRRRR
jgi:hypothetical protein